MLASYYSTSDGELWGYCRVALTVYPITIWFTGLIHVEQSYTGNKPIFEFEELSTTLLYLDQGKQHKAVQDHKRLSAAQLLTDISFEILALFIHCICTNIQGYSVFVCLCTHDKVSSAVQRPGLKCVYNTYSHSTRVHSWALPSTQRRGTPGTTIRKCP